MTYKLIISIFLAMNPDSDLTNLPCSDCHSPEAWIPLAANSAFKHESTNFKLEGRHRSADCIQCHSGLTVEEIHNFSSAVSSCEFCHMDVHLGLLGSGCGKCHEIDSWEMTNWTSRHDHLLFPLVGAHAYTDCSACHGKGLYQYSGSLTTECFDCHRQIFIQAQSSKDHSDNPNCINCHNTQVWVPADMSHHDLLFPIYSGDHRGEWSTCEAECHINLADYSDFSCGLNGICHEHRQLKMDEKHRDENVKDYVYESAACFDCHPRGRE